MELPGKVTGSGPSPHEIQVGKVKARQQPKTAVFTQISSCFLGEFLLCVRRSELSTTFSQVSCDETEIGVLQRLKKNDQSSLNGGGDTLLVKDQYISVFLLKASLNK